MRSWRCAGTLATRSWPHAAACCGDWLVTHAGVHPSLRCAAAAGGRVRRGDQRSLASPRAGGLRRSTVRLDRAGPRRHAPHGGIFWTHPVEWNAGREVAVGSDRRACAAAGPADAPGQTLGDRSRGSGRTGRCARPLERPAALASDRGSGGRLSARRCTRLCARLCSAGPPLAGAVPQDAGPTRQIVRAGL